MIFCANINSRFYDMTWESSPEVIIKFNELLKWRSLKTIGCCGSYQEIRRYGMISGNEIEMIYENKWKSLSKGRQETAQEKKRHNVKPPLTGKDDNRSEVRQKSKQKSRLMSMINDLSINLLRVCLLCHLCSPSPNNDSTRLAYNRRLSDT